MQYHYGLPMSPLLPRKLSMPNLSGASSRPRGTLICKSCQTRIASRKSVLSWSFRGNEGKAALFTQVSNVIYKKPSVLLMDSGVHTVEEFSCRQCTTLLGWRIVRAHEWPEKWKEGYFILELSLLEEPDSSASPSPSTPVQRSAVSEGRPQTAQSESDDTEQGESEEPKVAAFNAYLQVASALSMGHRRASSDMDSRRPRPAGPRAITPTPPTPPRRSVHVQ